MYFKDLKRCYDLVQAPIHISGHIYFLKLWPDFSNYQELPGKNYSISYVFIKRNGTQSTEPSFNFTDK